jgi:flagellar motor switch protein FliN/FliY
MPLHESISSFLNDLTAQMRDSHPPNEEITVSWREGQGEAGAELIWWSCSVSVEEGCRIWCGAPTETWEELRRAYESASGDGRQHAAIQQAIEKAAQQKFGTEISIEEIESAEDPGDAAAAKALIEITTEGREFPPIQIALSEAMLTALGVPVESEAPQFDWSDNPVERLLHVEVPVSVLLGRAKLRMKDVLALSGGSIVELEQDLHDEVEIRVNNCVIARGEMVAVDGNYGVKIVEMVSQNGKRAAARIGGAE